MAYLLLYSKYDPLVRKDVATFVNDDKATYRFDIDTIRYIVNKKIFGNENYEDDATKTTDTERNFTNDEAYRFQNLLHTKGANNELRSLLRNPRIIFAHDPDSQQPAISVAFKLLELYTYLPPVLSY